ncbi:MAG: signal recognition particle receptor subunit alpha, partial [Candidatus Syntrophosphaera sp.]
MFSSLSEKLDIVFKNLRGKGYLTAQNIKDALRQIRMALLEADVNFKIAKNFVAEVEKRALGAEVMNSLTPGQQVVKIVHEQLIALMDTEGFELKTYDNKLTKVMLVGLQGSGKTTACAKLALHFRKKHLKTMMVACDVYRPAAIDQLISLGKQIGIPVITEDTKDVLRIADSALSIASKELANLLIFDTAGRLHIDEEMMDEV